MQYYFMGAFLSRKKAQICENISLRANIVIAAVMTLICFIYQPAVGKSLLNEMHAEYFYDDIVVTSWVFFLTLLLLRVHISDRTGNMIRILSSLTLGVYIVHPFIIDLTLEFFKPEWIGYRAIVFIAVSVLSFSFVYVVKRIPLLRRLVML